MQSNGANHLSDSLDVGMKVVIEGGAIVFFQLFPLCDNFLRIESVDVESVVTSSILPMAKWIFD